MKFILKMLVNSESLEGSANSANVDLFVVNDPI